MHLIEGGNKLLQSNQHAEGSLPPHFQWYRSGWFSKPLYFWIGQYKKEQLDDLYSQDEEERGAMSDFIERDVVEEPYWEKQQSRARSLLSNSDSYTALASPSDNQRRSIFTTVYRVYLYNTL